MKKILIMILVIVTTSRAHAANLMSAHHDKICPESGWEITYRLKNPDIQPPRKPVQNVMFCIEEKNKKAALTQAARMADMIEHPAKYAAKNKAYYDQKEAELISQKNREDREANELAERNAFVEPDNVVVQQ